MIMSLCCHITTRAHNTPGCKMRLSVCLSVYTLSLCCRITTDIGAHNTPGCGMRLSVYTLSLCSQITTDINNGCEVDFEGTSSAAPLAAGVFALVLEANPLITWRDMQHLLAMTAHVPNGLEGGWTINGGGLHVNHK